MSCAPSVTGLPGCLDLSWGPKACTTPGSGTHTMSIFSTKAYPSICSSYRSLCSSCRSGPRDSDKFGRCHQERPKRRRGIFPTVLQQLFYMSMTTRRSELDKVPRNSDDVMRGGVGSVFLQRLPYCVSVERTWLR